MEPTPEFMKYIMSRGYWTEDQVRETWNLTLELFPEYSTKKLTIEIFTRDILQKDWNRPLKERLIKAGKQDLMK